jgi:hypothetical protein
VPAPPRHSALATASAPARPITTATPTAITAAPGPGSISARPSRSVAIPLIPGDFTRCTETSGNGWRIAGTTTIPVRRRMGVHGSMEIAGRVWYAAALGGNCRSTCAPPTGMVTAPVIGSTLSVSEWPGRLPLDSFPRAEAPSGPAIREAWLPGVAARPPPRSGPGVMISVASVRPRRGGHAKHRSAGRIPKHALGANARINESAKSIVSRDPVWHSISSTRKRIVLLGKSRK